MISRSHRYHGFNALRHVYSRGQSVRGPLLALKYIFNNKRDSYRAAVVVSRKVHKSAVVRNRIRRRIYEIIRLQESNIVKPYDLVLTVFSDQVAEMEATELEKLVLQLLQRAGVVVASRPTGGGPRAIVEQRQPKEHS